MLRHFQQLGELNSVHYFVLLFMRIWALFRLYEAYFVINYLKSCGLVNLWYIRIRKKNPQISSNLNRKDEILTVCYVETKKKPCFFLFSL